MNIINKGMSSFSSPKFEKLIIKKQDTSNQIQNSNVNDNFFNLEKDSPYKSKILIYKKIPPEFIFPNNQGKKIINLNDSEMCISNSNNILNHNKNNKKIYITNSSTRNGNKTKNYYHSILTNTKIGENKNNFSKVNINLNSNKNKNKFKTTFSLKEAKNKVNKSNINNNSRTIDNKQKYNETKLSPGKTKVINRIIKLKNEPKIINNLSKYSRKRNNFRINSSEDNEYSHNSQIMKKSERNTTIKNITNNKHNYKFCKKNIGLLKISNSKDKRLISQKNNSLSKLNIKDITNNDSNIDDKHALLNNTSINNYDIINIIKKKEKMKVLSKSFFGDSKKNLSNEIQIINDFPKEKIKHFINEDKTENNKNSYNSGQTNKWKKYCIPIVSASLVRDDKDDKDNKENKENIDNNKIVMKINKTRNKSAVKFGEENKKKREILFNFNFKKILNNTTNNSFQSHSNRATSYKEKRDQHLNDRINSKNDNNSIFSLIENDLYLQEQKLNEIHKCFTCFNISADNVNEYKINNKRRYKKKNGNVSKKKIFHLKINRTKLVVERKNKNDAKELNYIVIKRGELLDRMRKLKHMKDSL